MLKTEIEYKRGILFVRLFGEVNRMTVNNLQIIDQMIKKAGIKYLLINLEKATIIQSEEIDTMIEKYKNLIGANGKLLICGYYNLPKLKIKSNLFDNIFLFGNEMNAFNIINI